MESFNDIGYVLKKTPYTERGGCIHVLTKNHGVYMAFVYSSDFKKLRLLDCIQCHYKARLHNQLGTLKVEQGSSFPYMVYTHKIQVLAIESLTELLLQLIENRIPVYHVFQSVHNFIQALEYQDSYFWLLNYAMIEIVLLQECGYALNTKKCVITGQTENLMYLSPKSGSVVTKTVGDPYKNRLFILPQFLLHHEDKLMHISYKDTMQDVLYGMDIFFHFIRKLFPRYTYDKRSFFYKYLQQCIQDHQLNNHQPVDTNDKAYHGDVVTYYK